MLALGDTLTSFNPIYGQGITVAACEALELRAALIPGLHGAHRRFFRAAARVIDIPWQLAVGGDLALPNVPGPRSLPVRAINAYIGRVNRAAQNDSTVARTLLEVIHMLKRPLSLFAPNIVWRVLRGSRSERDDPAGVCRTEAA